MGPVTSNIIFGFRSDVILKLLNLYARQTYPTIDEHQLKQLVPLLLQQLYEKMRTGDTSVKHRIIKSQKLYVNLLILFFFKLDVQCVVDATRKIGGANIPVCWKPEYGRESVLIVNESTESNGKFVANQKTASIDLLLNIFCFSIKCSNNNFYRIK